MTATLTKLTHLNSAANDYTNQDGVRISCPLYIELTNIQRKNLLNAARSVATAAQETAPKTQSGIVVSTSTGGLNKLESYIGCSFEILRSQLFQRGSLSADLILKLQIATGYEVVSVKEIEAALKARAGLVKQFVSESPFDRSSDA